MVGDPPESEPVVLHIPVVESEKQKGLPLAIGGKLSIHNSVFGDLDELVARYLQPINELVEEMVGNDKYCPGGKEAMDATLRGLKAKAPKRVHYLFCLGDVTPTTQTPKFLVGFIANVTPHHGIVRVLPGGFSCLGQTQKSMHHLVKWFKKCGMKDIKAALQAPPPVAAGQQPPPMGAYGAPPPMGHGSHAPPPNMYQRAPVAPPGYPGGGGAPPMQQPQYGMGGMGGMVGGPPPQGFGGPPPMGYPSQGQVRNDANGAKRERLCVYVTIQCKRLNTRTRGV